MTAEHISGESGSAARCGCVWADDGEPLNVGAAIEDALEWLQVLRRQPRNQHGIDRLDAAMEGLARFGCQRRRSAPVSNEHMTRHERTQRLAAEFLAMIRSGELRACSLPGVDFQAQLVDVVAERDALRVSLAAFYDALPEPASVNPDVPASVPSESAEGET